MKETDKYIDQLFNAAKKEPPKISFEEMAERFESSILAPPTTPSVKSWWSHLLNLNTFIMLSTGALILSLFFFTNSTTNEHNSMAMEQKVQEKEIITEVIPENNTTISDTPNTKVEEPTAQSIIEPGIHEAKKTIIPKNNSINTSSKNEVSLIVIVIPIPQEV